jgi:hypothetical protein
MCIYIYTCIHVCIYVYTYNIYILYPDPLAWNRIYIYTYSFTNMRILMIHHHVRKPHHIYTRYIYTRYIYTLCPDPLAWIPAAHIYTYIYTYIYTQICIY